MHPKKRREKAKADLRRRILDAARALFVKREYEAVTMRDISRRIGYTTTALYYQFPDKASLLRELCEQDFHALAEEFKRLGRIADPIERIRKAGRAYVSFGVNHPEHYRLMFMSQHPQPPPDATQNGGGDSVQAAFGFLLGAVQEAMATRRFRPELKDAHLVAQALWASVHGVVALHLSNPGGDRVKWRSAEKTAQLATGLFVDGLLR
jgi:AcrR family transcriptional regulator